ncbi:hypothetical protein PYW08_002428 [Mythimna loreyi]|uniref:Uncharacterized protein n=3 Tax=Mythimna loreyi TaxID=667449 RepID=A0ACC2R2P9_9NEOP|nr:hypothetical protein PYW08_013576 [Mythimna loreyi]KAJ8719783.1 hypothetical protein PYW08_011958 [Mythimna loreyi]KAJ8731015.1 hypothetical protein PYW08_002428 [Mythimna loreyi]
MSQYADVLAAQKALEESFMKKMSELEGQIQCAGPAKSNTVAKIADEFRAFRELIFSMLGLLRSQINECAKQIDTMEMRHRRKALVFQGLAEKENEDCTALVLETLNTKLALKNLQVSSIKTCHRLGAPSNEHHRPILVRFTSVDIKAMVWKAKTGLKGSKVSIKEFLTRPRQFVFGKAREHFGMRACWTQDGVICIKAPDGVRHKITSTEELKPLISKYPKTAAPTPAGSGRSMDAAGNLKAKSK